MPEHQLADEIAADLVLGMRLAAYHFEDYFTETDSVSETVSLTLTADGIDEQHSLIADRYALVMVSVSPVILFLNPQTSCIQLFMLTGARRLPSLVLR